MAKKHTITLNHEQTLKMAAEKFKAPFAGTLTQCWAYWDEVAKQNGWDRGTCPVRRIDGATFVDSDAGGWTSVNPEILILCPEDEVKPWGTTPKGTPMGAFYIIPQPSPDAVWQGGWWK